MYLMALSAVSCVMQKVISVSIASLGKNGENLSPCISCFKVEQCFWRGALGDISPKVKRTRDAPKPWALFHLHPAIKRKISKVQAGSICRLKREGISSISLQITPCVRDDTLHEVSMNRTSRSPHNCDGMGSHGQQTDGRQFGLLRGLHTQTTPQWSGVHYRGGVTMGARG